MYEPVKPASNEIKGVSAEIAGVGRRLDTRGSGGFKVRSVELTCATPACLNLVEVSLEEYKKFGKPYCAECAEEAKVALMETCDYCERHLPADQLWRVQIAPDEVEYRCASCDEQIGQRAEDEAIYQQGLGL